MQLLPRGGTLEREREREIAIAGKKKLGKRGKELERKKPGKKKKFVIPN